MTDERALVKSVPAHRYGFHVYDGIVALRTVCARVLAEWGFRLALGRMNLAFQHDLGLRRHFDADGLAFHHLERLAEILGSLQYLRAVCGANEGQKWRNEMQALIDAEAPSGDRRRKIVAGFNRGYRGFQQTYRTCTPAAGVAIRRYLDEGAKIARDITARYAN